MKNTRTVKKTFFHRHFAFFLCLAIVFFLFAAILAYDRYFIRRPMLELKELPIRALFCTPYKFNCPVKYAGSESRMENQGKKISLEKQIPGAFAAAFLYDLEQKDITLEIIWIDPRNRGKFHSYYEINSPEIKEELLKFIAEHEEDLQNNKLQHAMWYMVRHYRDELTKLGDGDPYVGLERAGIPGWIKDGKDPEEEWRKKYPPETR